MLDVMFEEGHQDVFMYLPNAVVPLGLQCLGNRVTRELGGIYNAIVLMSSDFHNNFGLCVTAKYFRTC